MCQSSPHTGVQLRHEKSGSKSTALQILWLSSWACAGFAKARDSVLALGLAQLLWARAGLWQGGSSALHTFALVFPNTQPRGFPYAWVPAQLRAKPAAGAQ